MLKYGDVLSGRFPSCSLTAFLWLASKKGKCNLASPVSGMTINKTDFQTEESRNESGKDGETLNATAVCCCIALHNAKVHTGGSKHGAAAC